MQLIEAQTVQELIAQGAAVVDATWCMPGSESSGQEIYLREHITGACYFDIDEVADKSVDLPHMLPSSEQLASALSLMGIDNQRAVVVYDQNNFFASARVAWMLSAFGHGAVYVLNGDLKAWQAVGGATDSTIPKPAMANYSCASAALGVASLTLMRSIVADGSMQILDARALPRFNAQVLEPRPGLRSGHMPGAICVPFTALVNDGALRAKDELTAIFAAAGVDIHSAIVTTCGSGVSAAVINLALLELGVNAQLYDGSWSQWASLMDTPVIGTPL